MQKRNLIFICITVITLILIISYFNNANETNKNNLEIHSPEKVYLSYYDEMSQVGDFEDYSLIIDKYLYSGLINLSKEIYFENVSFTNEDKNEIIDSIKDRQRTIGKINETLIGSIGDEDYVFLTFQSKNREFRTLVKMVNEEGYWKIERELWFVDGHFANPEWYRNKSWLVQN